MLQPEPFINELEEQTRFAHSCVSNYDEFEYVGSLIVLFLHSDLDYICIIICYMLFYYIA